MNLNIVKELKMIGVKMKVQINIIKNLHKEQMELYKLYHSSKLTLGQYLKRLKPIDLKIAKLELTTLLGTPASQTTS